MRALLALLVVAVIVVAGWLGYRRFLRPPEARACAAVADRCDLADEGKTCERFFRELRKAGADETVERLAHCLIESSSCADAAGCASGVGGALFSRAALDFLDGLRRGSR